MTSLFIVFFLLSGFIGEAISDSSNNDRTAVEVQQYALGGAPAGPVSYADVELTNSGAPTDSGDFGKVMYLTFDDGPSPGVTPMVLDTLKEYGVKATFFIVGAFADRYPDLVLRIVNEGHAIGLHSYTHNYREIYASADAFMDDLRRVDDAIYEIAGVRSRVVRFPGGSVNGYDKATYDEIVEAVSEAGFVFFDWNASLQDAVKNPVASVLFNNAVATVGDSDRVVLLAHDRIPQTAQLLGELLDYFGDYHMELLTPVVEPIQFKAQH
ncbi:MAG: polysaccharide deacetylase [Clostridiales bacterium]|nr:polysaccharide deacetylase [Clostridiales bacterium]